MIALDWAAFGVVLAFAAGALVGAWAVLDAITDTRLK